jgi:hypothetical protein
MIPSAVGAALYPRCYPNLISPYPVAAQPCPMKSTQQKMSSEDQTLAHAGY